MWVWTDVCVYVDGVGGLAGGCVGWVGKWMLMGWRPEEVLIREKTDKKYLLHKQIKYIVTEQLTIIFRTLGKICKTSFVF